MISSMEGRLSRLEHEILVCDLKLSGIEYSDIWTGTRRRLQRSSVTTAHSKRDSWNGGICGVSRNAAAGADMTYMLHL